MYLLFLFFLFFFPITEQSTYAANHVGHVQPLLDYEKDAFGASVIPYGWSEKDQQMKILFSHEKHFKRWTNPGGKRDPGYSVRETAANELFEETAAFPKFAPEKILSRIHQLPLSHKFKYGKMQPIAMYLLNVGDIDAYAIDDGWRERVSTKNHSFREMNAWQWIPVEIIKHHFDIHKNDAVERGATYVDMEGLPIRNVCYKSLQAFSKRRFNFDSLLKEEQRKYTMSRGVIAIMRKLETKHPSSEYLYSILRGIKGNQSVLSRPPTERELDIMLDALKKIANDHRVIVDKAKVMRLDVSESYQRHRALLNWIIIVLREKSADKIASLKKEIPKSFLKKVEFFLKRSNKK